MLNNINMYQVSLCLKFMRNIYVYRIPRVFVCKNIKKIYF